MYCCTWLLASIICSWVNVVLPAAAYSVTVSVAVSVCVLVWLSVSVWLFVVVSVRFWLLFVVFSEPFSSVALTIPELKIIVKLNINNINVLFRLIITRPSPITLNKLF